MARETLARPEVVKEIFRNIENWQSRQEGGAAANYKRRVKNMKFRSTLHEYLSWVTRSQAFDGKVFLFVE